MVLTDGSDNRLGKNNLSCLSEQTVYLVFVFWYAIK